MTIIASDAFKIAALDAGLDLIDGGSGDATGDFYLSTAADAALAALPFSNPAFAGASNVAGVITAVANAITPATAITPGVISKGAFRDRSNANVLTFSIAVSGGDMTVASATIPANATSVVCSSLGVQATVH